MQLITDIAHFHPSKESVLTIGTFDGIHVGHQRIIAQVVATAKAQGLTLLAYCTDPNHRGARSAIGILWDRAAGHTAL